MNDNVAKYFLVKVEFETINESNGKPKKIKTQYLVESMTCTEAEARVVGYLKDSVLDYQIVGAAKSPIEDIILVPDPELQPKVVSKV
jgi:hypothetical protein